MKIRNIIGFAAIVLSLFAGSVFAQDDTKSFDFTGFNEIEASGAVNVYLTQGSSESIKVETTNFDMDKVVVEKSGKTLKVYTKNNSYGFGKKRKVDIYITCINLNRLEASGASDVYAENSTIKSQSLEIYANGASDINILVDVTDLKVKASGASDTKISGKADNQKIEASGASDFEAYNLAGKNVEVKASGGSDVNVQASERLEAKASGGSDIRYKGNPKNVYVNSNGGSSIKKR
jgi:hypothetical protein